MLKVKECCNFFRSRIERLYKNEEIKFHLNVSFLSLRPIFKLQTSIHLRKLNVWVLWT